MTPEAAAISVVPANRATREDIEAVFATRGDAPRGRRDAR
jgi:hypothetical protein